jgi:Ser/Thr protein kinase RdoA (MazF antagonist)
MSKGHTGQTVKEHIGIPGATGGISMNQDVNDKSNPGRYEQEVLRCLHDHYLVEGQISRLMGENLNYLVSSDAGEQFVFKIVDDDMPPEIVAMENEAIEHAISAGFHVNLPRILKNRHGEIETGIDFRTNVSYRARLLEYIDGMLLESVSDISIKLIQNLGKMLAEFDLSMSDFEHPVAHRNHRWNLAEAGQHRAKLTLIEDSGQRELLTWAFDLWAAQAQPVLPALPHQFIHGDAHKENILVKGDRVTGLVDFGDCCFNPVICELGVCLPYMMMRREDPLKIAVGIVAAYHDIRPLSGLELGVLAPLICGRLAVTVGVAAERMKIDPHRPGWFEDNEGAWNLLQFLCDNESSLPGLFESVLV